MDDKDYKGLKFGGTPAYVISVLGSVLTTCIPLAALSMWLIDKKLPTSTRCNGTKWKIWLASGVVVQVLFTIILSATITPNSTKTTKDKIENAVETVVEDKRQCDDIEKELISNLDGAIGASLQAQGLTVIALENAQEGKQTQAEVDKLIQSINSQAQRLNSYSSTVATLSQEYGDECSDSRREAFTAKEITPRNEKLLALAGEMKEASTKINQLESEQKEKAELERITPEQRAAYKAFHKYRFVREASLPEVRSRSEKFRPTDEALNIGAGLSNEYSTDPILDPLKEEAKAEVVRMDNDERAKKVEKFLANGTTISAKSNYDLIKQLEPDHPAVARFAKDFEPKPEPVVKEEPKPAAPTYKSAKAALREICQAGVEYSQDGIGTSQQIAHELAYWVIDLHRETGGKASEAALRKAGSDGYMFEDCSKY